MALTIKIKRMEIRREGKLNWVFLLTFRFSTTKCRIPRKQHARKQFMLIYASIRWICFACCWVSFHARIYKTPLQLQFNHLSCDIVRLYSRVSFAFVIVSILFHGILKTSCLVRNIHAAVKRGVCILTAKISVYGTVGAISAAFLSKLAFIWV